MAEADLADIASTLEEIQKAKTEAEEKAACYARERAQLQSQLDENEEELAEVRSQLTTILNIFLAKISRLVSSVVRTGRIRVSRIAF